MSLKPIKYFFDLMSQPSRALYIFLKVAGIPFEEVPVALRNGEHLSEEFKKNVSKFSKVPLIHDGDFRLTESVAIIRYVSRKFDIDNNWYPKDVKKQAQVDEYLEWQHNNTRAFLAIYFQRAWLLPLLSGQPTHPKQLESAKNNMIKCLDDIESLWLADRPYIAGDQISVADIWAACEIEQPRMAGFDPRDGRPLLTEWLDRVRNETNPHYDAAHQVVNKIAARSADKEMKGKL